MKQYTSSGHTTYQYKINLSQNYFCNNAPQNFTIFIPYLKILTGEILQSFTIFYNQILQSLQSFTKFYNLYPLFEDTYR